MSEHEFDNYLTLLSKLLRLDGKQRDAIAGELRAHLEERLDELLARGVPRQEAIRLALEDFGDAAGLAAQFGSLSRNRRRRWLMRVMTFSMAATVLIAAGLAIFWPGRNAGPGVAAVVAQDPDEAKPAEQAKPAADGGAEKGGETTLADKLSRRSDFEFVELPLKDVMQALQDQTGVQFVLDQKRLEEAGVNIDIAVTKNLKQVRLSTLLELMLRDLELVYVEHDDDLIVITTQEEAESHVEIRVYDCRDLLGLPTTDEKNRPVLPFGTPSAAGLPEPGALGIQGLAPPQAGAGLPREPFAPAAGRPAKEIMPQFGGGGGLGGAQPPGPSAAMGGMGGGGGSIGRPQPMTDEEKRVHSLIMLVTTNVDPQKWDQVGGPGSISEYHGLIVVTQTAQTHKKVERVLDMLREAAGLEVGGSKKVVR